MMNVELLIAMAMARTLQQLPRELNTVLQRMQ
jgi:hypothetical protein